MGEIRVQKAALLATGKTQSFPIAMKEGEAIGFILHHEEKFLAFLNECPHWSVELDLGDEHFFNEALGRIYCKNHGALFRPLDGSCETGPCMGRSLTQYPTRVEGEDILVTL